MTRVTLASWRGLEVSSRKSDSGVVMRMSASYGETRPFAWGRVARPNRNLRHRHRHVHPARDVGNASQRCTEVPLDIDRKRLEGRDVENPAALLGGRRRLEHETVEAPQKRRERLAAAGRRQDERRFAACDDRPPEALRFRRRRK